MLGRVEIRRQRQYRAPWIVYLLMLIARDEELGPNQAGLDPKVTCDESPAVKHDDRRTA